LEREFAIGAEISVCRGSKPGELELRLLPTDQGMGTLLETIAQKVALSQLYLQGD
jgi:hypothetical protein